MLLEECPFVKVHKICRRAEQTVLLVSGAVVSIRLEVEGKALEEKGKEAGSNVEDIHSLRAEGLGCVG